MFRRFHARRSEDKTGDQHREWNGLLSITFALYDFASSINYLHSFYYFDECHECESVLADDKSDAPDVFSYHYHDVDIHGFQ